MRDSTPRRQVIRQFLLGSFSCWAGGQWMTQDALAATTTPVVQSTGQLILPISAFPALANNGGSIRLYAGSDQTLIINRQGNTFYALGSTCSHAGCPVGTYLAAEGHMRCPCHGSLYFIDGTVKAGPAPDPLDRFVTQFDGNSELRVSIPKLTFSARFIQVTQTTGETRRIKLSFHATPFRSYRIQYRPTLSAVAQFIPFSVTPGGATTQTVYRSTAPALSPPLTDLYVEVTSAPGFFTIVLIPTEE